VICVSVYSNLAAGAAEDAAAYIEAVLELLGDADPIPVLESTVDWCRERTEGHTREQLAEPESEDMWSIAGVLQHLADSELVWGYRLRKVLVEDRPQLTGYDQDRWASRLGYADADRAGALLVFGTLRAANLSLLSGASRTDLDRVGMHSERGEESVRRMIRLYAGHDLVHRRQLQRLCERFNP